MVRRCSMPLARQIWSKRWTRYRAVQPSRFFWQVGKLSQHRMQPVWHGCDQCLQEAHGKWDDRPSRVRQQRRISTCGRDKQVELALCRAQLGDVDMRAAAGGRCRAVSGSDAAMTGLDAGSSVAAHRGDRRAAARCTGGTRQQSPPPHWTNTVEAGCLGPVGRSATELRFRHLFTVFGLMPWRLASTLRLS